MSTDNKDAALVSEYEQLFANVFDWLSGNQDLDLILDDWAEGRQGTELFARRPDLKAKVDQLVAKKSGNAS